MSIMPVDFADVSEDIHRVPEKKQQPIIIFFKSWEKCNVYNTATVKKIIFTIHVSLLLLWDALCVLMEGPSTCIAKPGFFGQYGYFSGFNTSKAFSNQAALELCSRIDYWDVCFIVAISIKPTN